MKIQSQTFVTFADLFEGFSAESEFWSNMSNAFSFGDNNRSMIRPERLVTDIQEIIASAEGEDTVNAPGLEEVIKRCKNLPPGCMIDLEN